MEGEGLVYRLRKRAEIRRNNQERKSVQEGRQDRIADLLEEAARNIVVLRGFLFGFVLVVTVFEMWRF